MRTSAPQWLACALAACITGAAVAAPRVLPESHLPDDSRLKPLKDLDGFFPFTPPATVEAWNTRAEEVRRQMLVAFGLWPMPEKTPLNAVVHGRVERPEYTVEKVYFESYPGFFVTGSLYRPKNADGKRPVVLLPHGHFANGRFNEVAFQAARNQIAEGAERWENGGRYPLQAKCVTLARMGCIAFHYDMVGYADSTQLSFDLAHRFDVPKEGPPAPREAGFFSTSAELRCQSIMGLQTYNSLRAVDFVCGLPDVDPNRIGGTGASGGGTQTMILAALEPRVTAAAPVVMVSTAMQGGCTCENCTLLRVDTGNIEFAALTAPRPQLLIAANDWTKELGAKGLPELTQLYKLLGAPERVTAKLNIHFPHNYNFVSREAMYQFFNQHFKLGLESPVLEENFQPLSQAEMSVWDSKHPRPPAGDAFERSFCQQLADEAARQVAAIAPQSRDQLEKYRTIVGGALEVLLGKRPKATEVGASANVTSQDVGPYHVAGGLVRRTSVGSENPYFLITPKGKEIRQFVIWIDESGKSGLFADDGQPRPEVRQLLDAGIAVAGIDLYQQGEYLADGKPPTEMRRVANPRRFLGFTLGYNRSPFAHRVQDILTLATWLQISEIGESDKPLSLLGFGSAGRYVAGALAVGGDLFDRAAVDTAGFRFSELPSLWEIDMLPGAVKYGDLPGMLSLASTKQIWIAGETIKPPGMLQPAVLFGGPVEQMKSSAIEWLKAAPTTD